MRGRLTPASSSKPSKKNLKQTRHMQAGGLESVPTFRPTGKVPEANYFISRVNLKGSIVGFGCFIQNTTYTTTYT